MKLLLTSAGFSNDQIRKKFLDELRSPISESRVLMVAYARNPEELAYVGESRREVEELGFTNVHIANMHDIVDVSCMGDFDVIYVCGGNTFAILAKMREAGLDALVIAQVQRGAFYVGVSAGSIIAGPTIDMAGWGSEGDPNDVELKDLSGFGLVAFTIFPHYRSELEDEVREFRARVQYDVIELTNDEAAYVDGDNFEIVGRTYR